jgi:hypothetical protein
MKEAVEMLRRLSSWRRLYRSRRRAPAPIVGLALISVIVSSCGGRTGPTAAGPPSTSPAVSSSVTPTGSASPSVTPASWRRIASVPFRFDYFTPATAVWDGHEVLVVVTRGGPRAHCNESVVAYDPSSDSWRRLSHVPKPDGCYEGSDKAVWTGHELLLSGISNVAYDPVDDTWRHLPAPWVDAGSPLLVWTGEQMIGWGGGCCDMQLADGAAYTLATNSSGMLPPSPLSGRHAAGAWTGKELIIAGNGYAGFRPGGEPNSAHFADAAAYNPSTRTWRKLPSMPVGRGGGYYTVTYAAVWDGTEVLVVGGTNGASEKPLARGVAYDPSSNTWRWMAPMKYPREGFVTGWTGSQLVVWGGIGDQGAIPPGGEAYDPTTDTWSALPEAPLRARTQAVAVWTGSELIVWGGQDARTGEQLFDGAALTPASTS